MLALEHLDAPFIGRFLTHLEKDRGNTPRSRNVRLAAIHSFFKYVALEEPSQGGVAQRVLAIPCKRHKRRPIDFLTEPEIEALLMAPDQKSYLGRRDRALLLVAVQTGLRASELIGLRAYNFFAFRLYGGVNKLVKCELDSIEIAQSNYSVPGQMMPEDLSLVKLANNT